MTPEEKQYVENVLRHFTRTPAHDQDGNPVQIVEMRIDKRTTLFRTVQAIKAEHNTLGMDVVVLAEYMREPEQEIFKRSRLPSIGKR